MMAFYLLEMCVCVGGGGSRGNHSLGLCGRNDCPEQCPQVTKKKTWIKSKYSIIEPTQKCNAEDLIKSKYCIIESRNAL